MNNPFISIYRFFGKKKSVFYATLIASTLVFGYFASKIRFEENILELLPKTEKSKECAVAFGNIKVKDKIFIELQLEEENPQPAEIVDAMDGFMAILQEKDKNGLIANLLYRFDTDDIMNLAFYAEAALPCHLGGEFYKTIDPLLNRQTIERIKAGESPVELPEFGDFNIFDWHLMSPDQTMAIGFLTPNFLSYETEKARQLESILSSSVREYQLVNQAATVLYHGSTIEGCFNSRQIIDDLFLTVGISLLLIIILMCLSFGSARVVFLILYPIIYGTAFSMSVLYWIKGEMSLIAIGIGAIVLGVAISYCLHILIHRKYVGDIEQLLKDEAKPVCLGCLTTIGAFGGLLLTTSELLKDFGIFASLALVGTTLFALVFLPQFLSEKDSRKNEKAFKVINRINSYPLDRNKAVVGLMSLAMIITISQSSGIKFDNNLTNLSYRSPLMIKSEELYNGKLNGVGYSMYYAAFADNLDSAITYNRHLAEYLDTLQARGIIKSYSSPEWLLVPESEQAENIAQWKKYWTAEKRNLAYKLLKEESDLNHWTDSLGYDIPETFKLMSEADYEPQSLYESGALPEGLMCNYVEQNEDGWMVFTSVRMDRANLQAVHDSIGTKPHMIVLDPFYYTGDMVEIAHKDFNVVLLISSIFVFLVLLLSYRSLLIAVIAFLPMGLSWYIVQGFMAMFGIQFNLVNIMISTFIFGIGVDYSIFVMDGLISKAKYNSYRLLVFHKVAIFFSAAILIIVTGSLIFAKHPAIHSIGICTIVGMASTILITYAIQPLLFRLAMKNNVLRKRALHEK